MANVLIDFGLQEQIFDSMADMESILESLDKKAEDMDIKALCAMVEDVIDQLQPERDLVATDSMRDIVQKAAAWIDSHYAESLTLASVAERYHVESSYFSKIFRQDGFLTKKYNLFFLNCPISFPRMSFIIKLQVIIQQVCTFTALTVKKRRSVKIPLPQAILNGF